MPVALYMDVHVPQAVTEQLLRRRVDVLTAIEDDADCLPDDELLDHANALGRIMVTFDIRFLAMAEQWQGSGREFAGLVYAYPLRVSIGNLVHDLELIANATQPSGRKRCQEPFSSRDGRTPAMSLRARSALQARLASQVKERFLTPFLPREHAAAEMTTLAASPPRYLRFPTSI